MQILYSFGLNEDGQCGNASNENVQFPYPVKFPFNRKIKHVSSGSRHTLILTECGEVYSCGWGSVGQLGHGNTLSSNIPKKIDISAKIIKISAGGMHSACIDENYNLYTWGSNTYGQLGFQNLTSDITQTIYSVPCLVTLPGNEPFLVKDVCCGGMHTLAISNEDNRLYAWGRSDCGQTGYSDWYLGPSPCIFTPLAVSFHRNIDLKPISIQCSGFFSLILNYDGLVYAMGKEDYGCLGTSVNSSTNSIGVESPTLISALKSIKIKQISTLGWHSCFLDVNGNLYVTGKGEYGRLGLGNESSKLTPIQITKTKDTESLLALQENSLTTTSSVNTSSSTVNATPFNSRTVSPVDTKISKILQVSAGGSHTIWRDEKDQVFTVGRVDNGRCGLGQTSTDRCNLAHNITKNFYGGDKESPYKMKIKLVEAGGSTSYVLIEYSKEGGEDINELTGLINDFYKNLKKNGKK